MAHIRTCPECRRDRVFDTGADLGSGPPSGYTRKNRNDETWKTLETVIKRGCGGKR